MFVVRALFSIFAVLSIQFQYSFAETNQTSWVHSGVHPNPKLPLCYQIAIKNDESTIKTLIDALDARSDPQSDLYASWLSQAELRTLLESSKELPKSRNTVYEYIVNTLPSIQAFESVPSSKLVHHGETEMESWCGKCRHSAESNTHKLPWMSTSSVGDMFVICSSVADTELLFNTKLSIFSHLEDGTNAIRASTDIDIPESVANEIDFIGGINTPIHSNKAKYKRMDDVSKFPASSAKPIASSTASSAKLKSIASETLFDDPELDRKHSEAKVDSSDACRVGIQSPEVKSIIAGNEEANVIWQVKCVHELDTMIPNANNNVHTNLPPCFTIDTTDESITSDTPITNLVSLTPYVKQFELVVFDQYQRARIYEIPSSSCIANRCTASIPLNNYDPLRVQVRSIFSSGFSYCSHLSLPVAAVEFATIHFIQNLYGIPSGHRVTNTSSSIAVVEFLEQFYNPVDLDDYLYLHGLERNEELEGPFLLGPNIPKLGAITGGEAQLDIQIAMGLTSGAPMYFWSEPSREVRKHNNIINAGSQEPFLSWLFDLADASHPPIVQSVSYGDLESEIRGVYAQRLNIEFVKCGLRGITLVFAAGDSGVNGEANVPEAPIDDPSTTKTTVAPSPVPESTPSAKSLSARDPNTDTNDISNTIKIEKTTVQSSNLCIASSPNFPTSSPYVLAVGATQLSSRGSPMCQQRWHGTMIGCEPREVVCSASAGGIITSGGGFSNFYPQPKYQAKAVNHYLKNGHARGALPHHTFFNAAGRGYPDVTAYGTAFPILMNGTVVPVAGTSASTPVIASILTLWNSELLNEGLPPVGFINPILYHFAEKYPEFFNDVIVGDNSCAERGQACCPRGFKAMSGWDAASGIGSPKYAEIRDKLIEYARVAKQKREIKGIQSNAQFYTETKTVNPVSTSSNIINTNDSTTSVDYATPLYTLVACIIVAAGLMAMKQLVSKQPNHEYQSLRDV